MSFVGPLKICVTGDDHLAQLIRSELESDEHRTTDDDLVFVVSQAKLSSTGSTTGRSLRDSRAPYRFSTTTLDDGMELAIGLKEPGPWLYSVGIHGDVLGQESVEVDVRLPRLDLVSRITRPIMKLFSRDGLSLVELAAKNVVYEVIDPVIWLRLLTKEATLIHASAVAIGESAVVFSGAGGVGKSSALLALMQEAPDARYISDDMAIVAPGGWIARHPKRMQVYEYNLRSAPAIRYALQSVSTPAQRRMWDLRVRVRGPHRVRRRVSAGTLFGEHRVVDHARISRAVWVVPSSASEPQWTEMSGADFAEMATTAILSEFWDFLRLLNAGSMAGGAMESVDSLARRSRRALEASLVDVDCRTLSVPSGLPGTVLASFLQDGLG